MSGAVWLSRSSAPGCTDPTAEAPSPLAQAKRGSQRRRPGPAPQSPRRPRLREPTPAAPRPLRGPATRLFPDPRAARAPRRPTTPFPGPRQLEPAADSRVRGSPSRYRPRSASPVTHRRREGAARAQGGGRGAPHSLRDPTPCSEPTELRRLCLAGLSLQPEP